MHRMKTFATCVGRCNAAWKKKELNKNPSTSSTGQKHQRKDADAHIVKKCPERHGAKMRPGKAEFLVVKAEASFMEESPNPKIHVGSRWLFGGWLDMDGGGEENTKRRVTISRIIMGSHEEGP